MAYLTRTDPTEISIGSISWTSRRRSFGPLSGVKLVTNHRSGAAEISFRDWGKPYGAMETKP
jgi:hypothetical protein